jgi:hypothetical protein
MHKLMNIMHGSSQYVIYIYIERERERERESMIRVGLYKEEESVYESHLSNIFMEVFMDDLMERSS